MLLPHGALVLAVDGGRMQLLRNTGTGLTIKLEQIDQARVNNPPNSVLNDGRPGRRFESSNAARGAYPETDTHQRREDTFSCNALDQALASATNGEKLVVIAPPTVMGVLRNHLESHHAAHAGKRAIHEIVKDLSALPAKDMAEWLSAHS